MKCAVVNCNRSNKRRASTCSFFRIPTDKAVQKKWISFCGRKQINPNTSHVCMHHFKREDFENNIRFEMGFAKKRILKVGAVPSINISNNKNDELYDERARRIEKRENKKIVNFILNNSVTSEQNEFPQTTEFIDDAPDIESQQPEKQSEETNPLAIKVKELESEILVLRKEKEINEDSLKAIKRRMEKIDEIHKKEKEKVKRNLSKSKLEILCVKNKLKTIFTKDQISSLENGTKCTIWSRDDIARSLKLYAVSPKMYRLLYKKHFPIPSVSTLQNKV